MDNPPSRPVCALSNLKKTLVRRILASLVNSENTDCLPSAPKREHERMSERENERERARERA